MESFIPSPRQAEREVRSPIHMEVNSRLNSERKSHQIDHESPNPKGIKLMREKRNPYKRYDHNPLNPLPDAFP